MEHIIEINGLNKSFGDVKAVRDLSFHVQKGELFAFLGVNGAGKSTTISIMCGQLCKDSGSVVICGENIEHGLDKITRKLGVVFQNSVLDKSLSVRDNLRSRAALYGITGKEFKSRLSELAAMLDFETILDRTVGKLSGGQRRRVDIARALLHKPEILILDEPTAGLDPAGRESILENIRAYQAAQHAAVVMVSHSMEEIASNVDRLIVMEKGTAVMNGAPGEVFSHAAELVAMGLNVPCMTQVLLRLQQLGVNVPASAYTVEQAADILEPLLKGGARIC